MNDLEIENSVIKKAISLPADYIDIRIINSHSLSITAKDKKIEGVESDTTFGIGVRALYEGNWGFATTNSENNLLETTEHAVRIAKSMYSTAGRHKNKGKNKDLLITLSESKVIVDTIIKEAAIPPVEESIELIMSCESNASMPQIKSTSSSLVNGCIEKLFLNSEGSRIEQKYFRSRLGVKSIAKKGDELQEAHEVSAGFSWDHNTEIAKNASKKAIRLLGGKKTPNGELDIIMDPRLVGVFVHEALGHMAEADLVMEGQSMLAGMQNKKIASPMVNIYDDGTADGYGKITYDDEGVPSRKTALVESGVLKGYMHSRQSAGMMGVESTGNGRAQGYGSVPVVRMTNTYIDVGEFSFEELLEDVKKGVYLLGSRGGQTDPTRGVFQFSCEEGYYIENGEIKHNLRDAGISGNTIEVLSSIRMLASDFSLDDPGYCGKKGQNVPVDGGGPHVLTRAVVGGA